MGLVTLDECPEGLFWFNGTIGFKSEYGSQTYEGGPYQCDAYVVSTGEYFWGGAKSVTERGDLLVQPIHYGSAVSAINGDEE